MKNIKNLEKLVSYYNNKADWTPTKIKDFVKIKNDFYHKDLEAFDEIAGFDDDGYGEWSLESRDCDGWAGLDDLIEKFCGGKDLDIIANDNEYSFLYPIDDEQLCFSLERFGEYLDKYNYRLVGWNISGYQIKLKNDYIDYLENKINEALKDKKSVVNALKDDENLSEVEKIAKDILIAEGFVLQATSNGFRLVDLKDKNNGTTVHLSIYYNDVDIDVDNNIVERTYYVSIY